MLTPIVVHGNIIKRERAQFSAASQSAAIRELVDNCVDANATLIEIVFDARNNTISIRDDGDGCADLSRFFDLGSSSKLDSTTGNIGRYGIGGTWAGMYLCDEQYVTSVAQSDGLIRRAKMPWTDASEDIAPFSFDEIFQREPSEWDLQRGTVLDLIGIRNGSNSSRHIFQPGVQKTLREILSKTYGAAIARGGLCIGLNDDPIEPCDPPAKVESSNDLQFDMSWHGKLLRVHARHMAEEESWKAGVYVAYRGRLLNKLARPWEAWVNGLPIWVWIDLWDNEDRWHLTWSKDGFEGSDDLLSALFANARMLNFIELVDQKAQDIDSMLMGAELSNDANEILGPLTRVLEKRPGDAGEKGTVTPISSGIERRKATVVDANAPGQIDEMTRQQRNHSPYHIVLRDLGAMGAMYQVVIKFVQKKKHNQTQESTFSATVTINIHNENQRLRMRNRAIAFPLIAQAVMLRLAKEHSTVFDSIYFRELGEPVGDMITRDEYALKLAHVLMLRNESALMDDATKQKRRGSR